MTPEDGAAHVLNNVMMALLCTAVLAVVGWWVVHDLRSVVELYQRLPDADQRLVQRFGQSVMFTLLGLGIVSNSARRWRRERRAGARAISPSATPQEASIR